MSHPEPMSAQQVDPRHEAETLVAEFCASYEPSNVKSSAQELAQISKDARESLELNPPAACMDWWATLPAALQQKWLVDPKTPTVYGAWIDSQERRDAVNSAVANVFLSGFKPGAEFEKSAQRYISGEIDLAAFVQVPSRSK